MTNPKEFEDNRVVDGAALNCPEAISINPHTGQRIALLSRGDEVRYIREDIATPPTQQAVPDYKLLLVEPTDESIEAICKTLAYHNWPGDYDRRAQELRRGDARKVYDLIVAAAPAQESRPVVLDEISRQHVPTADEISEKVSADLKILGGQESREKKDSRDGGEE